MPDRHRLCPLPVYAARLAFVVELAEHLHAYGTTAQRLEGALDSVATSLQMECEPWSNPTGLILTFSDPARPPGESDTTRVIRLPPGETDLAKLCEADRIAEDVMAGRIGSRCRPRGVACAGPAVHRAGQGDAGVGIRLGGRLGRRPAAPAWLDIAPRPASGC